MRVKGFILSLLLVSIFQLQAQDISSVRSGNWTNAETWDCSCVPGVADNVYVGNHTIALTANTNVSNITISSGGVVNHGTGNKQLNVAGNYHNDGREISTTNGILNLSGVRTKISGTGLIALVGGLNISGGAKYILTGTDLVISDSDVSISAGVDVVNNGIINLYNNLIGTNATSTWDNGSSGVLNIGGSLLDSGTLTAGSLGNTISYNGGADQSIKTPVENSYANLKIAGAGTKSPTGDLIVLEDLVLEGGAFDLTTNNYNLTIQGNFDLSAGGSFVPRSSILTFSGDADQNLNALSGLTVQHLVKSGFGNLISSVDIQVNSVLDLLAGNINLGANKITLGQSSLAIGVLNYTSGAILGTYVKWIDAVGLYLLPVGHGYYSNAATIDITGLAGSGGTLSASFTSAFPGTNGFLIQDTDTTIYNPFLEGYWSLGVGNALNITGYNLDLDANGFYSFMIAENTRLVTRTSSDSPWAVEGTHVPASGMKVERNGMSSMPAHFAIGDVTPCTPPSTSSISGEQIVCTNSQGSVYSVTETPESTYDWMIEGGSITSGFGEASITVTWGETGMVGSVQVQESNDCTVGQSVSLTVNIEALPTESITGRTSVPENQQGETYSVPTIEGYTYEWSVVGGEITEVNTASGESVATVNWGTSGEGNLCVTASNECGQAPQVCLLVNKYIVIESLGTGGFDAAGTWDCQCIPGPTDNVKIKAGHVVTLNSNTEIANMIIDGTVDAGKKQLMVSGDFTVNGLVLGSSANGITISGVGNMLDGVGSIANSGPLKLEGGSKSIYSGASLTKSIGSVEINGGIVVTNKGSFSVGSGDLLADNEQSTWINGENSTLVIGAGTFVGGGLLIATANNNTVEYNGAAAQDVYNTNYANLNVTGNTTINLNANNIVSGNMYINSVTTFNTNNFNLNVGGNWINDGGLFNPGTGTVIFDGTGIQQIYGLGNAENFNNVVVQTGSSLQIAPNVTVTALAEFLNNGSLDNDGYLVLANGYSSSGSLSGNGVHELVGGNWVNNGSFIPENSTVKFTGSVAQTISGASIFNDLIINNSGGVSVGSGMQQIEGTLTINAGVFSTAGLLTLVSSSEKTARIAQIQTGSSIVGDVTSQRYISSQQTWRLISSPTQSTFEDWQNEFWTSGYPGATYENYYGFISLYSVDETQMGDYSRYHKVASSSQTMIPGQGYLAWVGGWPVGTPYEGVIDATGPVFQGPLDVSVTYTVLDDGVDGLGNPVNYDGLNLIANPYPSDIDLSKITLNNVDNFVYVYDPAVSDWVSKSCSSGEIITQHQAFYVQASADGSVSFDETCKVGGNAPFSRTSSNKDVYFTLSGLGYNHDIRIRLQDEATIGFDGDYDAYQLKSANYYAPYLASQCSDGDSLDINAIPSTVGAISIPIVVAAGPGRSGRYTLSASNLEFLNDRPCVFLEDLEQEVVINLKEENSYTFNLSDNVTSSRFILHLGERVITNQEAVSCNGNSDGKIVLNINDEGPWNINTKDVQNNLISSINNFSGSVMELDNLPPGEYILEVNKFDQSCGSAFVNVIVEEPEVITIQNSTKTVNCFGGNDGEIMLTSSGGSGSYSYIWSNGKQESELIGLTAGEYMVTVLDDNGCEKNQNFIITEPSELVPVTSKTDVSCVGNDDGFIMVELSGGVAPYRYIWANGITTSALNQLSPGDYLVSVSDSNNCNLQISVEIVEPLILSVSGNIIQPKCFGDNKGSIQVVSNGGVGIHNYSWSNGLELNYIENLGSGTYTLSVSDENNCLETFDYEIIEPLPLIAEYEMINTCYGLTNGEVQLVIEGGQNPYITSWDNGQVGVNIGGLAEGTHSYVVEDNNGCLLEGNVFVEETNEIIANFVTNEETIYLSDGGNIDFYNASLGALEYYWDFGDNQFSVDESPSHQYLLEGTYTVRLTAYRDNCENVIEKKILVESKPIIAGLNSSNLSLIQAYFDNNKLIVNSEDEIRRVTIHNTIGQTIVDKTYSNQSSIIEDNIVSSKGIYVVKIVTEEDDYQFRFEF